MNCPNCGTSNPETSSLCANCGRPLASSTPHSYTPPPPSSSSTSYTPPRPPGGGSYGAPPPAGQPIPNYLIQSILVTICCCQPLGIVAIIFAAMVNSKLASGDTAGALDASSKAKLFFWISLALAVLGWLIVFMTGGLSFLELIRNEMENR